MDKIYYNEEKNRHPLTWMFQQAENGIKDEYLKINKIGLINILSPLNYWNLIPNNIENAVFLNNNRTIYFITKDEPRTISFKEVGFGQSVFIGKSDKYSPSFKRLFSFDPEIEIIKMFGLNNTLFVLICKKNRVSKRYILKIYNFTTKDISKKSIDIELPFDDNFVQEERNISLIAINEQNLNYIFISNKVRLIYICLQYPDRGFIEITEKISLKKNEKIDILITNTKFEEDDETEVGWSKKATNKIIKKQCLLIFDNISKKIVQLEINEGLTYSKDITKLYKKIPSEKIHGIDVIHFASNTVFNEQNNILHPKQSLLLLYSNHTIYSAKNISKIESTDFMPLLSSKGVLAVDQTPSNLLDFNIFIFPKGDQDKINRKIEEPHLNIDFHCSLHNFGLIVGDKENNKLLFLSTQKVLTQIPIETLAVNTQKDES